MTATSATTNTLLGRFQPRARGAKVVAALATIVLGSMFITVCAKINVPVWPVPVTLQSFAVAALAAGFGLRLGVATVALYLIEGAVGLPVFAGATAGIPYLMGPTGGFLLGFLVMAAIIGLSADRGASGRPLLLLCAMLIGETVLFAFGFAWLIAMAGQASWIDQTNLIGSAFAKAVQPFIVWDCLKMAFAALSVAGTWGVTSRR